MVVLMLLIPAPRRQELEDLYLMKQRLEDLYEYEENLVYIVNSRPVKAYSETLSQKNKRKKFKRYWKGNFYILQIVLKVQN